MDIFDRRVYRINKVLMATIGQWPYQPMKQRQIQWILIHISIGTVTLVQAIRLVQLWGNIDEMIECIVPMGVQTAALLKSTNCILNCVELKRLLDLIKKNWEDLTDEREMKILEKYTERGYFLGLFYAVCAFGSMSIYLLVPVMPQILDFILPLNETRPRQFLYQTEYFIKEENYYTSIMIHNYIGTILTVWIIVSVDAMLLTYVHHVCGIFTIVGNRLENAMNRAHSELDIDVNIDPGNIYQRISNCVRNHAKILEFAYLMETTHSTTFLFQMATSMFIISASGLQVVSNIENYHEAFRIGQFILTQFVHLFVNSWPSQMLMDHSENFRDSVYFAQWYLFPLRGRHPIRLVMMRCLKPCKMTAGRVFILSMESYAKIMQTSMSYFTVLVSLR